MQRGDAGHPRFVAVPRPTLRARPCAAPTAIGAVLAARPLQRLGLLPYSLYLVHMPIFFSTLFSLRPPFPELQQGWNAVSVAWVGVCIAAALALSEMTYRCIERPCLRRKAAIGRGRAVSAQERAR